MAEVSDVVRTRRLEVVDDEDRVRVVVGLIHRDEQTTIYGLAVLDKNGRERAWVYEYADGAAEFGLDWGDNTVASLIVTDTGEPALVLAEEDEG